MLDEKHYDSTPLARKEKEIWHACRLIRNENKKITYHSVGEKLISLGYCRGSNSDLCRYISSWKKKFLEKSLSAKKANSSEIILKLLNHQHSQFNHLFNALEAAKKANLILQNQLYKSQQSNKKLKMILKYLSSVRRRAMRARR